MKKWITWLAFLPFALAIIFATHLYLGKIARLPQPISAPAAPVAPADGATRIQVALLLDVSGSMDGLIEQAKSRLWQIVNELGTAKYADQTPRLEIALYVYGGDDLDPGRGYVRQVVPLTPDLDLVSEHLFALRTSGGEEYCGKVIELAHLELAWSQQPADLRMIFVAGNEPFSQGPVLYKQACEQAYKAGILVNTIHCGDYREGVEGQWADGAQAGGGQYMHIDHNQTVADIPTPFDAEIVSLNSRLNTTYIAYGAEGLQKQERQKMQDDNAASYGMSGLTTRGVAKSKKVYTNSTWDLVDAAQEPAFELEKIDRTSLADSLQQLPPADLKRLLDTKRQEREGIRTRINELDVQRKAYIQTHQPATSEGLDVALIETVRKQAQAKNYRFD
ncbi:MAG: hypothetical protein OHK0039_03160 [Bacteroidia bacterium]